MSPKIAECDFLIDGISRLYTCDRPGDEMGPRRGPEAMREVGLVENAAVAAYQGKIVAVGAESEVRRAVRLLPGGTYRDAGGTAVIPGLVDPHTHAVFGRPRPEEFGRRLVGESYQSIAASGGGIRASVRDFRRHGEEELVALTRRRLKECLSTGTTTIEVKSGYGLDLESELKALRVLARLKGAPDLPEIVPTCLAAHEVPDEYRGRREDYLDLVCEEILPAVAADGLAQRVDVFCEPGVFNVDEARRVLLRGGELGLDQCLHADELEGGGGSELAAELSAASADHLGAISPAGIQALASAPTVGVLLPGTIFSLGLSTFAPAREMIDAGVACALATDFNPGSNYCSSMPLTLGIACTRMHLHPHEALLMGTLQSAWALRRAGEVGSIRPGKRCDLVVLRAETVDELIQHLGGDEIATVVLAGRPLF